MLSFIKAYRLRGDKTGLKCSVCEAFDFTALSTAHSILWKNCLVVLKEANLDYHPRRGSDKNSRSDLLLGDILVAFDYLDASNKLPPIYCEANDLIRLPPLAPDLVSEKLEHNTTALLSLSSKVDTLPSTLANSLSLPPVSQPQCSNLEKLVVELSEHLKAFSRNVGAISSQITTSASSQNTLPRLQLTLLPQCFLIVALTEKLGTNLIVLRT